MSPGIGYILRQFPVPSETFVINEITSLQDLGVDIHPISMFTSTPCQSALMSNVKRASFDLSKLSRKQLAEKSRHFEAAKILVAEHQLSSWLAEFAACISDYVLDQRLELIHAHFATESALTAMLVSELTSVPFSITAHAYDIFIKNDGTPGEARDVRIKSLVQRASRVIAISEYNKQFILKIAGAESASKIDVIHCGIDTALFTPIARVCHAPTFLCVGRFVEKKGHEYLVRAFAKVAGMFPAARLRLVGDGPLQTTIMELCRTLGVSGNVDFLGSMPSDQVRQQMGQADIFVLHSVTAANGDMEGIPVSLMEASASGLPVISTRHSGISELVVEGTTGLLTEERDVDSLSECMVKLASAPSFAQDMGRAGRIYVGKNFDRNMEAAKLKLSFQKAAIASMAPAGLDAEKAEEEMTYWRERNRIEGSLNNGHYRYFFTQHFGLDDKSYSGKNILDIGCGPRGSLEWATMARTRLGLDPLAEYYRELGTDRHGMQYLAAHAEDIPFPDDFFDLVSSFNSLDHVNCLERVICEIKRVLKPGGLFLLLTEVNHEPTPCEPIVFSWDITDRFTDAFDILESRHYERTKPGIYDSIQDNAPYDHSNDLNRIGIVSLLLCKKGVAGTSRDPRSPVHATFGQNADINCSIPSVSIIIPVYNGEETLGMCLESIEQLEYPKERFEVIVIDNGSTDSSVNIAAQYGVKILHESQIKSSYAARNVGIKAAVGDMIAFTDADCIVTPRWLARLTSYWDDDTVGCFAGEIEAYQPEDLIEKFSDRAGILRQSGTLSCPYLPYTQTANSAYRKTVFEKVGLFSPEMTSGGDADIAWRMQKALGLQIKFIPEALVYHKHRTSLDGLYRQFQKYECGKISWSQTYPDYMLPSIDDRRRALEGSIEQVRSRIYADINAFCQGEKDLAAVLAPFFYLTISLATYKARLESGTATHVEVQEHKHHVNRSPSSIFTEDQTAERKLETLEKLLMEKDKLLMEREQQLASCNTFIHELLDSMSWKITAPLRKIFGLFIGIGRS